MTQYTSADFFLSNLAQKGQGVLNTLGNKFKSNPTQTNAGYQAQQKIWGNTPVNNSATALTRNQRSANIKYGTAPDARTEALASQSVGRGLNKQQAPRNGQKPLAPDEFLDAGGVVRKKMSVGNWKSQQQFQTGQYGGFSSSFVHFANF